MSSDQTSQTLATDSGTLSVTNPSASLYEEENISVATDGFQYSWEHAADLQRGLSGGLYLEALPAPRMFPDPFTLPSPTAKINDRTPLLRPAVFSPDVDHQVPLPRYFLSGSYDTPTVSSDASIASFNPGGKSTFGQTVKYYLHSPLHALIRFPAAFQFHRGFARGWNASSAAGVCLCRVGYGDDSTYFVWFHQLLHVRLTSLSLRRIETDDHLTYQSAKILARIIRSEPHLKLYTDIGRRAFGTRPTLVISIAFFLELFLLRSAALFLFMLSSS